MHRSKKIALAIAGVGIIVVGGLLGWHRLQKSPIYTYYVLRRSIAQHDWFAFSKCINFEALYHCWVMEFVGNKPCNDERNDLMSALFQQREKEVLSMEDFMNCLRKEIEEGRASKGIFPELFALDAAKITSFKTDYVEILCRYGEFRVPSHVGLAMDSKDGKYYVSQIVTDGRNAIIAKAMRRWSVWLGQKEIAKNVSIEVDDFYNDGRRYFLGDDSVLAFSSKFVVLHRKITNHSRSDISKIVYNVCPSWWLDNQACVQVEDRGIKAGKTQDSWRNIKYDLPCDYSKTPDTISDLTAKQRRAIPTKVVFSNGDSIVVDSYAYLKRKQPSWQELVAFMKRDSLQYADSIEAWYQGR